MAIMDLFFPPTKPAPRPPVLTDKTGRAEAPGPSPSAK